MQYQYVAYNLSEGIVKGSVDARNEEEAYAAVIRLGFKTLEVTQARKLPGMEQLFPSMYKVGNGDLVRFCRHTATMIGSGASLPQALNMLQSETSNRVMRNILIEIMTSIDAGLTLSEAMAEHPIVFNELFINVVQVGELTGDLAPSLEQLADVMEQGAEAKGQVFKSLMMPAFNMVMAGIMLLMTMTVIMPKILRNIADSDVPIVMKVSLALTDGVKENFIVIIVGAIIAIVILKLAFRLPTVRYQFDVLKTKIPLVGSMIVYAEISRFSSTMALLLNSGIVLADAISLATKGSGNAAFQRAFDEAEYDMLRGEAFTEALRRHSVIPRMWVELVVVGEESNSLPKAMGDLAETYQKQLQGQLGTVLAILDPLATVVVGLVVALVAITNIQVVQASSGSLGG